MNFYVASLARENKGLITGVCGQDGIRLLSVNHEIASRGYVIKSKNEKKLYSLSQDNGKEFVSIYDMTDDGVKLAASWGIPGGASCHLTESPGGEYLYVANYGSGTVDAVSVKTGHIGTVDCNGTGNAKMHMVAFRPETDELFAVDLGNDRIYVFDYDKKSGRLSKKFDIKTSEGGPRHLAFIRPEVFYLVYENANMVDVFRLADGQFACVQSLSTLPENCRDESYAGAIKIAGSKLFVSNRGHDSIMQYEIQTDFTLKRKNCFKLTGSFPRDFAPVGEDKMIVTFQKSDKTVLYQITDTLTPISSFEGHTGAICVCL